MWMDGITPLVMGTDVGTITSECGVRRAALNRVGGATAATAAGGGSGIPVGGKTVDISLRLVKIVIVPSSLGPGHVDSSVKRAVVSKKSAFPICLYSIRYRKSHMPGQYT